MLLVAAALLGCRSSGRTTEARIDAAEEPTRAALVPAPVPAPPDVAAPPPEATVTTSGVAIKIIRPGAGSEHPADNDCVKVRFSAWRRDGTLFSSSKDQDAPVGQCLQTAMAGVADGLRAMLVGEAARLWVPARLTVKTDDADRAAAPVDLTFDLELVDIVRAPPTPADLAAPPASALRLASGLALRVLEKGKGAEHPAENSRVTMHFSGWRKDGTLFESTVMGGHPAVFAVRELIPGWREGLLHMVVGEKTRLWIPPALAYGEKPRRRGVPAGALVYDVELLALESVDP